MLVQTASVNVDCRKAEWLECFISCIIGCHTPARAVKGDEESRSEPHGTSKHNSELCSRIAHYSTARNRHFWRDTTDRHCYRAVGRGWCCLSYQFTSNVVYESCLHFGPHISDDYFAITPPETSISLRPGLRVSQRVYIVVSFF